MEWINVNDRVPEIPGRGWASKMVIATNENGYVSPMIYERAIIRGKTVYRWKFYWDRIANTEITHWMPLPEPPSVYDRQNSLAETINIVHGTWLPYKNDADKGFHYCSECNGQAFNYDDGYEVVEVLSNYCPNCGAKMYMEDCDEN